MRKVLRVVGRTLVGLVGLAGPCHRQVLVRDADESSRPTVGRIRGWWLLQVAATARDDRRGVTWQAYDLACGVADPVEKPCEGLR
jgi:hypothetical protein